LDNAPQRPTEPDAPEFSVLISCYFEESSIEEFHERLSKALESLGRSFEIIVVNDGSSDGTWDKIKDIFERDEHVHAAMDMFKNSGQEAGVTACLAEARGRAVVLIDSDLQLAPEELPGLVAEYDKGYDLVSGYRENRKDSLFRIIPSKIANMIMRKASRSALSDFGCTFKIYNGALLRAFDFGPHHVFSTVDVIARIGRYTEVPVTHYPRKYGRSGWTFTKLWRYNMDNIVRLTQRPFQLLAALCVLASALFLLRIAIGFASPYGVLEEVTNGLLLNALAVSLLLILGALAAVGEFTIRCFVGLQRSPAYIVREKLTR